MQSNCLIQTLYDLRCEGLQIPNREQKQGFFGFLVEIILVILTGDVSTGEFICNISYQISIPQIYSTISCFFVSKTLPPKVDAAALTGGDVWIWRRYPYETG